MERIKLSISTLWTYTYLMQLSLTLYRLLNLQLWAPAIWHPCLNLLPECTQIYCIYIFWSRVNMNFWVRPLWSSIKHQYDLQTAASGSAKTFPDLAHNTVTMAYTNIPQPFL